MTSSILTLVLYSGLSLFSQNYSFFDYVQLPFSVMGGVVHFDQYPHFKTMLTTRGGCFSILTFAVLSFSFSLFYTQDMIMSLVDVQLEYMPDRFTDIRTQSQHVVQFNSVPLFKVNVNYNKFVLDTLNFTKFQNFQATSPELSRAENVAGLVNASENYFVVLPKDVFYADILAKASHLVLDPAPDRAVDWHLRLSDEEIGSLSKVFILRKYEKWSEKFNLQILRIVQSDLLLPSKSRRALFNHRINPNKDTENMGYQVLHQYHLVVIFICLLSCFFFSGIALLMELTLPLSDGEKYSRYNLNLVYNLFRLALPRSWTK